MVSVPSDYTIIGTVLAIAVAIILLSGLALYVAFRVRETLRDEKGRGARAAKVAFLIGLLFLSGGVFYFFASGFNSSVGPPVQSTVTSNTASSSSGTTSSTSSPSSTSTLSSASTSASSSTSVSTTSFTSTSSTTSISTTSTTSTTTSPAGSPVSMSVAYPTRVSVGQGFYVQFTVYNNGAVTVTGASIDVGTLIYTFGITNATECNPQCTAITWSGGVLAVGNLNPGATVVNLGLKAPAQPASYSGTATLYYQGMTQPVTATIAIQVIGRP